MMVNTKLLFQDHGILFRSRNINWILSAQRLVRTARVRQMSGSIILPQIMVTLELWLSIDEQDFYENCWAIVAKQKISQLYDKKTMAIRLWSEAFDVEIQASSINVEEAIKSISIIEFGLISENDLAELFDR